MAETSRQPPAECGWCGEPGGTVECEDAAGTAHKLHRECWNHAQLIAGTLLRSTTKKGRKTARIPRRTKQ